MAYYGWAPYVPVAQKQAKAKKQMDKLRKKGLEIKPVEPLKGRAIAKTFWGKAWCEHLENFSDYENRLPRGRTYVRNGSVCHLEIGKGKIEAIVSGSDLYNITINIKTMPQGKWDYIRKNCTGRIGSLLQLLQGKFSDEVMQVVTDRDDGMFPLPGEITFECSCPDWAVMCKHVAAVLYGVGARLDHSPELLFTLRGVDQEELIGSEAMAAVTDVAADAVTQKSGRRRVKGDLSAIFGVELAEAEVSKPAIKKSAKKKAATRKSKVTAKKASPERRKKVPAVKTKGTRKSAKVSDKKATVEKVPSKAKRPTKKLAEPVASGLPKRITGKTIAGLRKRLDLSAAALASIIGVSGQTIYNWEKKSQPLNLRDDYKRKLDELYS